MSGLDGARSAYSARVLGAVSRGRLSAEPLVASPKHHMGDPIPFSGVTLISPPGSLDARSWPTYQRLGMLQTELRGRYAASLIMTEPDNFHVTGADLVAGSRYLDHITQGEGGVDQYLSSLSEALQSATSTEQLHLASAESLWRYAGLSLFGSALVALFYPEDERGYRALCQRRGEIYESASLYELGVRAPRPLMTHVTLAYFTELLARDLSAQVDLTRDVCAMNARSFAQDHMTIALDELTLHTFEDMVRYRRATPQLSIAL